jgi:hypothetical protein
MLALGTGFTPAAQDQVQVRDKPRVRILRGLLCQMPSDGIILNVFRGSQERFAVTNANFRKSFLPDWRAKSEIFSGLKGKSSLNELHCPLDS